MNLSNENIIHIKKDNIEYIQFKKLLKYSDIIQHGYCIGLDKNFRTAKANKENLNDDEYKKAVKSYMSLCDELNINYNNIVKTNQKHTKNVEIIEQKLNKDEPDFEVYKETDGLITNKKDIILSTTNADCILLIFFDPIKKVIANVHSGWRGTLQRISINTVNKMQEEYKCNSENIICCICPSIRKCHFEVDKDVYEMFYKEFQDLNNLEEIIEEKYIIKKENNILKNIEEKNIKWYIDTVLINKTILEMAGLKEENIIDCGICSVCNKDLIHSFRAEGENYGLSTAVITLK